MVLASPILSLFFGIMAFLGFDRLAPFSAVRWSGETPEVRVDDAWFGVESIDGLSTADVLDFARKTYGSKWQKRFSEDLVEVLSTMGHPPQTDVRLVLLDLDSKSKRSVVSAMTKQNRASVLAFNRGESPSSAGGDSARASLLSAADVAADLDFLLQAMEQQHSYYRLKGIDGGAEIEAIQARLAEGASRQELAYEVERFVARFGDGHSRLRSDPDDLFAHGYLPFLIGVAGEQYVAFEGDRTGLVHRDYPFVTKIDDRPIDDWIEVGASMAADGSSQFQRERGVRNVRYLQWAREQLGLPTTPDVTLTLGRLKGNRTQVVTLPVSNRKLAYGDWPRSRSRRMKEGVGYLRLPAMVSPDDDPDLFQAVQESMEEFRTTKGLVIDVRGNGGGTRHLLRTLLPYFLDPDQGPRVVNVAAKRLTPGDDPHRTEGLLGTTRGLFPIDSSRHDASARKAIENFAARFRPQWKLAKGEFSDWHYMVVHPTDANGTYYYNKPVILLINAACFSATDVFCAAFKGLPNVTLMGGATGGGSGRSRPVRLPRSGIELQLSSMASFQPDGSLFDGVGVLPDVVIAPVPTDFIGATDSLLDAAVARLLR